MVEKRGAPGSGFRGAVDRERSITHPDNSRAGEHRYARRRGWHIARTALRQGARIFTERDAEAEVNQLGIWLVVAEAVAEPPANTPADGVTTAFQG